MTTLNLTTTELDQLITDATTEYIANRGTVAAYQPVDLWTLISTLKDCRAQITTANRYTTLDAAFDL